MSREVAPRVFLIARPALDVDELTRYLRVVDGEEWVRRLPAEHQAPIGERLIEFMGRLCYRSWRIGLNPNITKIRTDRAEYLTNIIRSGHGSVLEHAYYTFVFHDVSRVFTHELVRHRVGTAVSQESLRYVRLTDVPFEHPEFIRRDPALQDAANRLLAQVEDLQRMIAEKTGLDGDDLLSFHERKQITSGARRYVPDGVATSVGWTANVRTLRHVIELRTARAAEYEMRRVFDRVARIMVRELPLLFSDFTRDDDGTWTTQHSKV